MHCGVWKFSQQVGNQLFHCFALLFGSGIFGSSFLIQTANVADAYAVGIMALAVCSDLLYWATFFHCAVEQNYIVVAYHGVAPLAVSAVYILGRKCQPLTGGRAVDYYFVYCSHGSLF